MLARILCLLLFTSQSVAFINLVSPEIGIQYKYAHITPKEGYREFFPKEYHGFEMSVSNNFGLYWGATLSWSRVSTDVKQRRLGTGSRLFEVDITRIHDTMAKVQLMGLYFDLYGVLPLDHYTELFVTGGFGGTQTMIKATSNQNDDVDSAIQSLAGKKRLLSRFGFGVRYMVTDMIGLTALLRWESTSALRLTGNRAFGLLNFDRKAFANTTSINLGCLLKF